MVKRVVLGSHGAAYARPVVARKDLSKGVGEGQPSQGAALAPDERSESAFVRTRERVQAGTHRHAPGGFVEPGGGRAGGGAQGGAYTHAKGPVQVSDLLSLAQTLTAADRLALLDQLALQNQMAAKAAASPDLDMWAEGVRMALDDAIGGAEGQYGALLVKRLLAPSASWRPVEAFMASSKLGGGLQRTERMAVYYMLARLLVDDAERACEWTGAPLSAKVVAQRTDRLAGVFEQSFPGYLASGLAPLVARQMLGTVTK